MRLTRTLAGLTAALALVLAPLASRAATTTTANIAVSATVLAACNITATPMAFGNYDPAVADVDATATFSVTCTNTTGYTYALNGGSTAAANNARVMSGPDAAGLSYGLYTDATRQTAWNAGTTTSVTGTGAVQTVTVYGRIPAGQFRNPGTYADTVVATVVF
jgi:spore coat protein U-like protein